MSLALVQAGVGSALHVGVEQAVDNEERSDEEGAFDPSDFAESGGQFVLARIGRELAQQLARRKGAHWPGWQQPAGCPASSAPLSVHPGRRSAVRKGIVQRTAQSVAPTPVRPAPGASHMNGTETIAEAGPYSYTSPMTVTLIGYARCSTDRQELGVAEDRIYTDHGLTGTNRARPGPRRRARRRHLGRAQTRPAGQVRPRCPRHRRPASGTRRETGPRPGPLRPGRSHGKAVLQYPRHLRRVGSRSHPHAHPRRHGHRPRQGEIARQAAQTVRPTAAGTLPHACHRRVFHQRSRRALLRLKTNRLSHTQPTPFPLAYDPAPYRNRPERVL